MKKNNWTLFFFLIICLLFSTCKKQNPSKQKTARPTKIIEDYLKRKIEVPLQVNRIACLYAFSGHVVVMLGKGKNIVAVINGLKRDKVLLEICPSIKKAAVPKIGGSLNIEELAKVKPDLIFVRKDMIKNNAQRELLEKFNIPAIVIEYQSIKEQQQAIKIIGEAIGSQETALAFNNYYDQCLSKISSLIQKIPPQKRIKVYHAVNEPFKTDAYDSLPADWIKRAGAINVSAKQKNILKGNDLFVNIEQILLWNPEVIITNESESRDFILKDVQWKNIKAVKNKKVYQMPNGISRWGHPGSLETPLALLWSLKTIYPKYAQNINLEKETLYFYENFFHYQLSSQMVAKILKGKGMRKSKKLKE